MNPRAVAFALGALALFTACESGQEEPRSVILPDVPEGRLRIDLMDAPFPLEDVVSTSMTITRLTLSHTGNAWSLPYEIRRGMDLTLDLLELQNGITRTIFDEAIPEGGIDGLRLHIEGASITLVDGRTFDLLLPSDIETGIEIVPDGAIPVPGGSSADLLCDFDLSLSFVPLPKGATRAARVRNFMLRPVVRLVDREETGSISGFIYDDAGTADLQDDIPLKRAVVSAIANNVEITRTSSDEQGYYRLMGLDFQSYTVAAFFRGFRPDTILIESPSGGDVGRNNFRLTREP